MVWRADHGSNRSAKTPVHMARDSDLREDDASLRIVSHDSKGPRSASANSPSRTERQRDRMLRSKRFAQIIARDPRHAAHAQRVRPAPKEPRQGHRPSQADGRPEEFALLVELIARIPTSKARTSDSTAPRGRRRPPSDRALRRSVGLTSVTAPSPLRAGKRLCDRTASGVE